MASQAETGDSMGQNSEGDNERPPAYTPGTPPDFVTQTQTETVVTRTTTITTFFRKRPRSKSGSNSRPSSSRGLAPREVASPPLLINKSLPPPPPPSSDDRLPNPKPRPSFSRDLPRSASYTALSLSLGVSLSPVLPHPPPLAPDERDTTHLPPSVKPVQRRVTVATGPSDPPSKPVEGQKPINTEVRRRRGFSLGPFDFLNPGKNNANDADQVDLAHDTASSKKSVELSNGSRNPTDMPSETNPHQPHQMKRPSFWRLRVSSLGSRSSSTTPTSTTPPPLPVRSPLRPTPPPLKIPPLQPSSPLFPDSPLLSLLPQTSANSNNTAASQQNSLLQRRHSTKESISRKPQLYKSANLAISTPAIHPPQLDRLQQANDRPGGEQDLIQNSSHSFKLPVTTGKPDVESSEALWLSSIANAAPLAPSQTLSSPTSFLELSSLSSEDELNHSSSTSQPILQDSEQGDFDLPEAIASHSPELYVERLLSSISKTEMAGVLASSGDALHTDALRHYMSRFDFTGDAIDIAIRKLLMELGLPKETQQIDRVMEAFAYRYSTCNPHLFSADDQPYILAFSMIMLHTDAFNKHNKNKMSKADYVKNTRLPGLSSEILEYIYDNIVFAPFIFIEDPVDVDGQPGFMTNPGFATTKAKSNKVDPYYLIANNLLATLRLEVDEHIPPFDPYIYEGTLGAWDEPELREAFSRAPFIEVGEKRPKPETPISFTGLSIAGAGVQITSAPIGSVDSSSLEAAAASDNVWTLRVTKVGLLTRKEDISEGGKKSANRKWREWSVILTGSQLLFFRDPGWATSLMSQVASSNQQAIFPHTSFLRPDELTSVNDAIVVYDKTYIKHPNTMRLILPHGRHLLLRAQHEHDMNEWIRLINYSSAFKTAGVRMRTPTSTNSILPNPPLNSPRTPNEDRRSICVSAEEEQDSVDPCSSPTMEALNIPFPLSRQNTSPPSSPPMSPISSRHPWRDDMSSSFNPSRSYVIRNKLREFETKITSIESQLESDLRVTRNLAILTPFQKLSREKLQLHVMTVAKQVQSLRLELAKLRCHKHVLTCDLKSAEDDMKSRRRRSQTMYADSRPVAPTRTRSFHSSASETPGKNHNLTLVGPQLQRSQSFITPFSPYDSERIATPRNRLQSSPNHPQIPPLAVERQWPETSRMSPSGLYSLDEFKSAIERISQEQYQDQHPAEPGPADEEAEEWNLTLAAKRVSLVTFPANMAHPALPRSTF